MNRFMLLLLCGLACSCAQDAMPPIACTGAQHCPPPSTLLKYAAQIFPSMQVNPKGPLFAQEEPQLAFDADGSALLRFNTGAVISGTVRDGTGRPVPLAHVTAVLPSAIAGLSSYSFDTTTTGPPPTSPQPGEFTLQVPVPPTPSLTPFRLYVTFDDPTQAASYPPLVAQQVVAADTTLALNLPPQAQLTTVQGRITDSTTGAGIGGMRVQVLDAHNAVVSTTAVSSNLAGVKGGAFQVQIDPTLTMDSQLRIVAQPGANLPALPILIRSLSRPLQPTVLQIDLPLPHYAGHTDSFGLLVTGVGESGATQGVAGARVQAQAYLPDPMLDQLSEKALYIASGVTDDMGQVSLDLVPANPGETLGYTMIVNSQSSSPFSSVVLPVSIPASADAPVSLARLPLRAQVSGRLLSAEGMPVAGAQVVARNTVVTDVANSMLGGASLDVVLPQTTTDQDGRFAMRLDQGDYDLDFLPVVGTQPRFSIGDQHILTDDLELGFITLPRPTLGKVQVLGTDGYPMRAASVRIFEVGDSRRQPACVPLLPCSNAAKLRAEVTTDSKGVAYFLLPDAPP